MEKNPHWFPTTDSMGSSGLHLSTFLSPGEMTSSSLKALSQESSASLPRQARCPSSLPQWCLVHTSNYSIYCTDCNCWFPCRSCPCLFLLTSEQGAWPRAEWAIKCWLKLTSLKFLTLDSGCLSFTHIFLVYKILPACGLSLRCLLGVLYIMEAEERRRKWEELLFASRGWISDATHLGALSPL